MVPYLILFTVPTIIWIVNDKIQFNTGNKILVRTRSLSIDVFMLMLLLLLAFRGLACGIDTIQYLRLYEQYSASDFLSLFEDYEHEIGYKILNNLVGVIFNNFQALLIITSIACVFPLWYQRSVKRL